MIIAMGCNKDWYHYLVVDLYSLLESNNKVKKIYLLLETSKVKDVPNLDKLIKKYNVEFKLINFNKIFDKLVKEDNVNRDTIYSNHCFAKLALPKVVKEDRVLYIDTDAIVLKDISNVWRTNLDDYYVAGVKDYGVLTTDTYQRLKIRGKYINSGFMLLNLKKIREDKIMEKWFEFINKNEKILFPDQDALNVVCQYKEWYIPSMYNYAEGVTLGIRNINLIRVFHYIGKKEQWVVNKTNCEYWYMVEEKFFDEFGL